MKSYIVLGLGRFGLSLAKTLVKLGHDVLAVDNREEIVQEYSDTFTHIIHAEASSEELLRSIGVRNFDAAVVTMSDIQASVFATVILKELGVRHIISKAINNLHASVLYKVGADKVVFPEQDMGIRAANSLVSSNLVDMIELSAEYSIMEFTVPKSWVNKTIEELAVRSKYEINIIAVKEGQHVNVMPLPDTRFTQNNVIAVLGRNEKLRILQRIT